jgi:hypothetical protein
MEVSFPFKGTIVRRDRNGFGIVIFDDEKGYGMFTNIELSNPYVRKRSKRGDRMKGWAVPFGKSNKILSLTPEDGIPKHAEIPENTWQRLRNFLDDLSHLLSWRSRKLARQTAVEHWENVRAQTN